MSKKLNTWLKMGQHLLRAAMVATTLPALGSGSPAPVDLNTADAPTLARVLAGVGPAKAQAIVEHRRRHGPFKSVDELALVKGIGPRTLERNRDRVVVQSRAGSVPGKAGVTTATRPVRTAGQPPAD